MKAEQFAHQGAAAAAEIAAWPIWMRRNLEPTTVVVNVKLPGRCIECRTPLWWVGKTWREVDGFHHCCPDHPQDGYAYFGCHCGRCEELRKVLT